MRAITPVPGEAGTVGVEEFPEPAEGEGALLVQVLLIGVCGTDREIADGEYGESPPGESRLIIGHEGLGEVLEAPMGCGVEVGDLVVGIVRRPDPVPCLACAAGEWDMCLTGIMNLDPRFDTDATTLNRNMVLNNVVLFGTVNAGRRRWQQAVDALAVADPAWLAGMITRRVGLADWDAALTRRPDDIKVVVDLRV